MPRAFPVLGQEFGQRGVTFPSRIPVEDDEVAVDAPALTQSVEDPEEPHDLPVILFDEPEHGLIDPGSCELQLESDGLPVVFILLARQTPRPPYRAEGAAEGVDDRLRAVL